MIIQYWYSGYYCHTKTIKLFTVSTGSTEEVPSWVTSPRSSSWYAHQRWGLQKDSESKH